MMLEIVIPATELYDEKNNLFITTKAQKITLKHSLVSLSKWESKWKKSFLHTENKTHEELLDYIRCMTITQNVDISLYPLIDADSLVLINEYINSPMTATIINTQKKVHKKEIVTSEIIYYWMVALNIPFECQKWHLNRLLTLINVCSIKNQPQKKMNRREVMNRNRELNRARRERYKTRG